jgi:hypothetical protein
VRESRSPASTTCQDRPARQWSGQQLAALDDIFQLTEIHRQARDSPVLQLATLARQGLPLIHGAYGERAVQRISVVTS